MCAIYVLGWHLAVGLLEIDGGSPGYEFVLYCTPFPLGWNEAVGLLEIDMAKLKARIQNVSESFLLCILLEPLELFL